MYFFTIQSFRSKIRLTKYKKKTLIIQIAIKNCEWVKILDSDVFKIPVKVVKPPSFPRVP